jgi:hypothetical protein
MWDIARVVAVQFINEYGPSAQDRALSLADATRGGGLRDECAEFYTIVARIVASVDGDAPAGAA